MEAGKLDQLMLIRYGYELTFNCPQPTLIVCLLDAHRDRSQELRYEIPTTMIPTIPTTTISIYLAIRAEVHGATRRPHDYVRRRHRGQRPTRSDRTGRERESCRQLPNETLAFLLGSRYCETDKLADIAWRYSDQARGLAPGSAICDFVCGHLTFRLRTRPRDPQPLFEAYQGAHRRLPRFRPSRSRFLPLHEYSGALREWISG